MDDNVKLFLVNPQGSPINEDAVRLLTEWLELARRGELKSVGLVGMRQGDTWMTAFSSSSDRLHDTALLLELAIRRLGFIPQ